MGLTLSHCEVSAVGNRKGRGMGDEPAARRYAVEYADGVVVVGAASGIRRDRTSRPDHVGGIGGVGYVAIGKHCCCLQKEESSNERMDEIHVEERCN